MKKGNLGLFGLIVGFLFIGLNAFAADGDLLVNGKVGIGTGTTDPVSPLEVRGSGSTRITESVVNGENGRNSSLLLRGTFTNYPDDKNQRNFGLITGGSDGTWEGSYINFGVAGLDCITDNDIDPCTRMTIKQGSVGIGTTSPWGKLHVNDPSGSITSIALNANGVNGANIVLTGDGATTPSKFIRVYSGSLQVISNAYNTVLLNISDSGNLSIGTPASVTGASNVLGIANGTAPSYSPSDMIQLYAQDVQLSELKVRDEGGSVTTLSPHNFTLFDPDLSYEFPWSYYSRNAYIGKEINIDMYGAIQAIEKLTGKKFIYVKDIPKKSWEENQERIRLEREAEIQRLSDKIAELEAKIATLEGKQKESATVVRDAIKVPEAYKKKQAPKWIMDRMN